MQAWIVKHVSRSGLYLLRYDDVTVTHNVPTVFWDNTEADGARWEMDVPDDWQVVEVEITEK